MNFSKSLLFKVIKGHFLEFCFMLTGFFVRVAQKEEDSDYSFAVTKS